MKTLALLIAISGPIPAFAADPVADEIVVKGKAEIGKEAKESKKARTSDTASLLTDQPGVALQGAGGVSSLPVVDGLADDRLRIKVDGMDLIACCPNHMNPALSYLDPSQVAEIKVYAGISPVSIGGDSIGATIIAESPAPEFAETGKTLAGGEVGSYYRSNGDAKGGNLSLGFATDKMNISYRGAIANSGDYTAGGIFKSYAGTGNPGDGSMNPPPGRPMGLDVVGSTAYETQNHLLRFALKSGDDVYDAAFGYQHVPYQLYPNQRMDMLNNQEYRLNLHYISRKSWGHLEARLYGERVDHYMNFGEDKVLLYLSNAYGMPMNTKGKTGGASLKAEMELSSRDLVRIGTEAQLYRLDDWWPSSGTGGMSPNTFWNINDGQRDRYAMYSEWEAKWDQEWTTLLGARLELVRTDAGSVQGYNSSYNSSAGIFNALDRERKDWNLDLTALTRYSPDEQHTYEAGLAQKTRTPNLYERYVWAYNSSMCLVMNNFVGDGNGYLGNADLKPETARTLSASASWHNADKSREIKVAPFFTYVENYIDAVQWSTGNTPPATPTSNQFGVLKFMNQTGRLFGVDVSGRMPLAENGFGEWGLKGVLSYVNGRNVDTGSGLYNIMPLNARFSVEQQAGNLRNSLEMVAVARKNDVSTTRQELSTPAYSLFNWRASCAIERIRFDFGVENIFDRLYYLPLGGAYTGQGKSMALNPGLAGYMPFGISVPGMGRSVYVGMNYRF